jgi:hypothetical protein
MWRFDSFLPDGVCNWLFRLKIVKLVSHTLLLISILHKQERIYSNPGGVICLKCVELRQKPGPVVIII